MLRLLGSSPSVSTPYLRPRIIHLWRASYLAGYDRGQRTGDRSLRWSQAWYILNHACSESMGADESRWASRTSNPLGGVSSVFGGFDSHALPPVNSRRPISEGCRTLLRPRQDTQRGGVAPKTQPNGPCTASPAVRGFGTDRTVHGPAGYSETAASHRTCIRPCLSLEANGSSAPS